MDIIGKWVEHYHILEPLGEGGMATVYKAYDSRLDCEIAIKFIRFKHLPLEQQKRVLTRFEREAKRMAQLVHPNIIRVTDSGEYEGMPYLVMPYLRGGTLRDMLKDRNRMPMDFIEAVRILLPIAHALAYVHQQETIHRDVKPANILLTPEGQPLLTDFGIAKILDVEGGHTLTSFGAGIGTPKYMAPEQWKNQITPQVDVYALGVVLYEMVTGNLPFDANTPAGVLEKQLTDPIVPSRQLNPTLTEHEENIISRAIAKDTTSRYADMQQFAYALEHSDEAPLNDELIASQPITETNVSVPISKELDTKATTDLKSSIQSRKTPRRILFVTAVLTLICFIVVVGISIFRVQQTMESQFNLGKNTAEKDNLQLTEFKETELAAIAENVPKIDLLPTKILPNNPTPVLGVTSTPVVMRSLINSIDGAEMVYVTEGDFIMGDDAGAEMDEKPQHIVFMNEYLIYQTEVTYAQYHQCVNFGVCDEAKCERGEFKNHPVVCVNWFQAEQYCAWSGGRLPTEAEWEKAARGTDERKFPWGNFAPQPNRLNYNNNVGNTSPVGNYLEGASPFGVLDLAGNVREWVKDGYALDYYSHTPRENPAGAADGQNRVIRGSSWSSAEELVRITLRSKAMPDFWSSNLGFRCVR